MTSMAKYHDGEWREKGFTYKSNSSGIGDMLNSEMMRRGMEAFAYEIKVRAEVLAAIEIYVPQELGYSRKSSGRYRTSFNVRSHLDGGATRDRAEAIMYNDSPTAFWVEFGTRGREPYHVIARAAYRMYKGAHRA